MEPGMEERGVEERRLPPEPKERWGRAILVAIVVLAVLIAFGALRRGSPPARGSDSPELVLPMLDGPPVDLGSLRGKVVLLDFWATWCPPCVESMPTVRKVADELADQGVVALAVNNETIVVQKREDLIRSFLRRHGLEDLRVALDDGKAALAFGVTGLPTLVVIGRDGKVAGVHLGAIDEEELRALLAPALAAADRAGGSEAEGS